MHAGRMKEEALVSGLSSEFSIFFRIDAVLRVSMVRNGSSAPFNKNGGPRLFAASRRFNSLLLPSDY